MRASRLQVRLLFHPLVIRNTRCPPAMTQWNSETGLPAMGVRIPGRNVVAEQKLQERLLRMQSVLRLVPNRASRAFEHRRADFLLAAGGRQCITSASP